MDDVNAAVVKSKSQAWRRTWGKKSFNRYKETLAAESWSLNSLRRHQWRWKGQALLVALQRHPLLVAKRRYCNSTWAQWSFIWTYGLDEYCHSLFCLLRGFYQTASSPNPG